MSLQNYIDSINQRYQQGNATEHTFRGDLQNLIESLVPTITATNEPKRQICGAPDYILTQKGKEIPIGFIEAKDLGDKDLEGAKKNGNKEQFDRYKISLDNIIFTDYLRFYFYQNQTLIAKLEIAQIIDNQVVSIPENFANFENQLKDFCTYVGQTIESPTKLAQMMAVKAKLLAEVIEKSLVYDIQKEEESTLRGQLESFKDILIHDVTPKDFADVYAQTIAYGMFAARYHDKSLDTFSRQEAYELIPKSNPFLKNLFGYIAGLDLDDRIKWIVDSLVEIFLATDIAKILQNFGKSTQTEDPIIHFYETFLTEYDPILRKNRGVWYTPQPVVNFIVRAVDDILKTEFELKDGLADSSQFPIANDQSVHRVQILDPATGTGTFLAEIIRHIYKKFEGQQGAWSNYVENNLLPRLNGFELLMASYAMAHLKLDMLLTETGFQSAKNQRFRVFLTNSLEEYHPDTYKLQFATWLSNEANEANRVKRNTPVMCIIGNPPYAVSSSNRMDWIQTLIADYKKGLKEKNINSLSDDYIKFIRLGQHFIDKNRSGVLAYISNNSFLDGITHRQMRKSLLESFDKIYIVDLHGNARKQETCTDGSIDQNVFDIMQGVSINIFVKTGKKQANKLGKVYHFDLQGKRVFKSDFLYQNDLNTIQWNHLQPTFPNLFFTNKQYPDSNIYEIGFKINDLFLVSNSGIATEFDAFSIRATQKECLKQIEDLKNKNESEIIREYKLPLKSLSKVRNAILDIRSCPTPSICEISYRPFDTRFCIYTGKTNGIMARPRNEVMHHMIKDNFGLCFSRVVVGAIDWRDVFVLNKIVEKGIMAMRVSNNAPLFPLYVYPKSQSEEELMEHRGSLETKLEEAKVIFENFKKGFLKVQKMFQKLDQPDKDLIQYYKQQEKLYHKLLGEIEKYQKQVASVPHEKMFQDEGRKPNLNMTIVNQIAEKLGLTFTPEKENDSNTFAPIDILDYIYAVLHSPTYREKYKEFLKIDFPRVPYPTDLLNFKNLANLGSQLRQIHLLESPTVENFSTTYPIDGDNVVLKANYQNGKVYINDTQYFDTVPALAWEFYIGGYQPAQKWLKDRKDRVLSSEEILHYQKIIVALSETDRLMKQIDTI